MFLTATGSTVLNAFKPRVPKIAGARMSSESINSDLAQNVTKLAINFTLINLILNFVCRDSLTPIGIS